MKLPAASVAVFLLSAAPVLTDTGEHLVNLPMMQVADYAAIHHDRNVLTVEMRADSAIGAAMFELPQRAAGIEKVPAGCVAVLVADETTDADEEKQVTDRLRAAGCKVTRLAGSAKDWIAAGLAAPSRPRKRVRPGDVPFVVPRGLCESNPPAQVFDRQND